MGVNDKRKRWGEKRRGTWGGVRREKWEERRLKRDGRGDRCVNVRGK